MRLFQHRDFRTTVFYDSQVQNLLNYSTFNVALFVIAVRIRILMVVIRHIVAFGACESSAVGRICASVRHELFQKAAPHDLEVGLAVVIQVGQSCLENGQVSLELGSLGTTLLGRGHDCPRLGVLLLDPCIFLVLRQLLGFATGGGASTRRP